MNPFRYNRSAVCGKKNAFTTGSSHPTSLSMLRLVGPGAPFFVKIWITPFAASEPYSVVAAPPGTYSM